MWRRRRPLREMSAAEVGGVLGGDAAELVRRGRGGAQVGEKPGDRGRVSGSAEHVCDPRGGDALKAVTQVRTQHDWLRGVRPREVGGGRPRDEPLGSPVSGDPRDQVPQDPPLHLPQSRLGCLDDADPVPLLPRPHAIVGQAGSRRAQPAAVIGEPLELADGEIQPFGDVARRAQCGQPVEGRGGPSRLGHVEGQGTRCRRGGPRSQHSPQGLGRVPGFAREHQQRREYLARDVAR